MIVIYRGSRLTVPNLTKYLALDKGDELYAYEARPIWDDETQEWHPSTVPSMVKKVCDFRRAKDDHTHVAFTLMEVSDENTIQRV